MSEVSCKDLFLEEKIVIYLIILIKTKFLERAFSTSKEPSDSEVTDAMAKVDKVIFVRRADHLQWSHMWDIAARSTTFRMFIRNAGVLRARGLEC